MTKTALDDSRFESEALRWLPELTRFARSLTRDVSDAEDLVQDTYLIAYRQWHQFDVGTECRAWLFTICRNRFYRTHGRARRLVTVDDADLESLAAAALHASAMQAGFADMFERSEVVEDVRRAIAELPDAFREVAALVDLHDQSYDEAARILGIPVGTVRSRLFRARRILQERLIAHAQDAGIRTSSRVTRSGDHPQ